MWATLMDRLGYDRYVTQGGDFGAYVAPAVAKAAPDNVIGVYVIAGLGFPTEADVPDMTEDEREAYKKLMSADWMHGVDHQALLRSGPQTFGYGWNDSPVAALAWMTQRFHDFNASGRPLAQVIDRDLFLTNLSIYWFRYLRNLGLAVLRQRRIRMARRADGGADRRLQRTTRNSPAGRKDEHDRALAREQPGGTSLHHHGSARRRRRRHPHLCRRPGSVHPLTSLHSCA
jgi:pimeloyl-ACP methyl ester carboxylesterase